MILSAVAYTGAAGIAHHGEHMPHNSKVESLNVTPGTLGLLL
jgi:hypothetical protein